MSGRRLAQGVSSASVEAVVTKHCSQSNWQTAAKLLLGAVKSDIVPSWTTYTTLLDTIAVHTNWLTVVNTIDSLGAGPLGSVALYRHTALRTVERSPKCGRLLLEHMAKRNISIDAKFSATLAAMMNAGGCYQDVLDLWSSSVSLTNTCDELQFEVLRAAAALEEWDLALRASQQLPNSQRVLWELLKAVPSASWEKCLQHIYGTYTTNNADAKQQRTSSLLHIAVRTRATTEKWQDALASLSHFRAVTAPADISADVAMAAHKLLRDTLRNVPSSQWATGVKMAAGFVKHVGSGPTILEGGEHLLHQAPLLQVQRAATLANRSHQSKSTAVATRILDARGAMWVDAIRILNATGAPPSAVMADAAARCTDASSAFAVCQTFSRLGASGDIESAVQVASALYRHNKNSLNRFLSTLCTTSQKSATEVAEGLVRTSPDMWNAGLSLFAKREIIGAKEWESIAKIIAAVPSAAAAHPVTMVLKSIRALPKHEISNEALRSLANTCCARGLWHDALLALTRLPQTSLTVATLQHVHQLLLHQEVLAKASGGEWESALEQLQQTSPSHTILVQMAETLLINQRSPENVRQLLLQIPRADRSPTVAALLFEANAAAADSIETAVKRLQDPLLGSYRQNSVFQASVIATAGRLKLRGSSALLLTVLPALPTTPETMKHLALVLKEGISSLSTNDILRVLCVVSPVVDDPNKNLLDTVAATLSSRLPTMEKPIESSVCDAWERHCNSCTERAVTLSSAVAVLASELHLNSGNWEAAVAILRSSENGGHTVAKAHVAALLAGHQWKTALQTIEMSMRRSHWEPAKAMELMDGIRPLLPQAPQRGRAADVLSCSSWEAALYVMSNGGEHASLGLLEAQHLLQLGAADGRLKLCTLLIVHMVRDLGSMPTAAHFNMLLRAASMRSVSNYEVAECYTMLRHLTTTSGHRELDALLVSFALEMDLDPTGNDLPPTAPQAAQKSPSFRRGFFDSAKKQQLAIYYPILQTAPTTPDYSYPAFDEVSRQCFQGRVSAHAIAEFWYMDGGKKQEHLRTLYEQKRSLQTATSDEDAHLLSLLSANIVHSKSGGMNTLASTAFMGKLTSIQLRRLHSQLQSLLVDLQFLQRSNGQKQCIAHGTLPSDTIVAIAHHIHDRGYYKIEDVVDPLAWLQLTEVVFEAAVPPSLVQWLCKQHAKDINIVAKRRISQEGEKEIVECVQLTGRLPRQLICDESIVEEDIQAYWRLRGSAIDPGEMFSAAEMDHVAQALPQLKSSLMDTETRKSDAVVRDVAAELGRTTIGASRDLLHMLEIGFTRLSDRYRQSPGVEDENSVLRAADDDVEIECVELENTFTTQYAEENKRLAAGKRLIRLGGNVVTPTALASLTEMASMDNSSSAAWKTALSLVGDAEGVTHTTWKEAMHIVATNNVAKQPSLHEVAASPKLLSAATNILYIAPKFFDKEKRKQMSSAFVDELIASLKRWESEKQTRHGLQVAAHLEAMGVMDRLRTHDGRVARDWIGKTRERVWKSGGKV